MPTLHAVHIDDHTFPYGIQELITSIERAAKRAGVAGGAWEREEAAKPQREEEREREEEERQREEERKRRFRTLAALALGAVAVAVAAFLLVSSGGGDDDSAAAVDGARSRSATSWSISPLARWAVGGEPAWRVDFVRRR